MTSVARRYGGASAPFERPATADDPSLGAPVVLMVSGGADSCALRFWPPPRRWTWRTVEGRSPSPESGSMCSI